ncbi:MAG: CRISPR-associated endonuclease Cas2 [Candidatus Auribacter fodinae]|uniref:CRISPR-associated endoribonuclease Cas2 n=1 Tax=Candidatus Auribacter fodinae TaxID=2093366 RepID=A0A3A4QRX4_9BACT|nr:MAG: CRISPR-associated endonuclease Cas2 [Candidatus Auribacter fodinae]
MLYWLIYDISSNSKRLKVSEKCKDYGLYRVQKSAFLGDLSKNKAEMLLEEVQDIMAESEGDCVFMFPACKGCFSSRAIIGEFNESLIEEKEFVFLACSSQ